MNTGSPSTMFVICLCDPVSDIKSPPKDAYAVLAYRIVSGWNVEYIDVE